MCVCVSYLTSKQVYAEPIKGVGYCGANVMGGCESPNVETGNQTSGSLEE